MPHWALLEMLGPYVLFWDDIEGSSLICNIRKSVFVHQSIMCCYVRRPVRCSFIPWSSSKSSFNTTETVIRSCRAGSLWHPPVKHIGLTLLEGEYLESVVLQYFSVSKTMNYLCKHAAVSSFFGNFNE